MRHLTLAALITIVTAAPAAGQETADTYQLVTNGVAAPIFTPENARRALLTSPQTGRPSRTADWNRVLRLDAGDTVLLATDTRSLRAVEVLFRTDAGLVTLNVESLPKKDAGVLRRFALTHETAITQVTEGRTVTADPVRVGPDGVFIDSRRVGDAAQIFEFTPRERVLEILDEESTARARVGAFIGTFLGVPAGMLLGAALVTAGAPRAVAAAAGLAGTIGCGWVGYHSAGGAQQMVVYRR